MVKNYLGKIIITVLAAIQLVAVGWYIHHDLAQVYVRYGPAAQLNTGDIKSSHILDGAILSADMANYNSLLLASSTIGSLTATSSVSLPANSVTDTMIPDTITASNYLSLTNWFATTSITHLTTLSGLTTASSSNIRASNDLRADGTLTLKGVAYTPPSADGSNGQSLVTNGAGALSWTTAGVAKYYVSTTACTVTGTTATTTACTITLAPGDFGSGNVLHIGGTVLLQKEGGSNNIGSAIQIGNGTSSTTLVSLGGLPTTYPMSRYDVWITASSTLLAQNSTGMVYDSPNEIARYSGVKTTYNANNTLFLSFQIKQTDATNETVWQGITIEKY